MGVLLQHGIYEWIDEKNLFPGKSQCPWLFVSQWFQLTETDQLHIFWTAGAYNVFFGRMIVKVSHHIDILIITLDQRRPAADFLCAVVKRFKHITLTKTVRVEEDMLVVELQL